MFSYETFSHRYASVGWPAIIYLQQLCMDTGCSLEYLPEAMDDRDGWRERERELGKSVWEAWHDDGDDDDDILSQAFYIVASFRIKNQCVDSIFPFYL